MIGWIRVATLALAALHLFPARKHLALLLATPSLGEAWKGLGAVLAIAFYLLPVRAQAALLVGLWRRWRVGLSLAGALLVVVHAVPALDHVPALVASPNLGDAWRGIGSIAAMAWFLLPLDVQARSVGALRRWRAPRSALAAVGVLAALALLLACSGHTRVPYAVVSAPRDWAAHPAIAEVDGTPTVYAMSDVHGGYDRMIALLSTHGLVAPGAPGPEAAVWSGGASVLVVTGDLMDKGPAALEALSLLRTLEPQAEAAGGHVIFTLGNHEAEFLDDPENDKANKSDGVDREMLARGLAPVAIANGSDPLGVWLRDRPFGARVGAWFFAHAGSTRGRSIPELDRDLQAAVVAHDYDDPEIVGSDSILEARGWYGGDPSVAQRYADALGVRHIVFGHQPDALGARGAIATAFAGLLFRIDCGMSPDVDDSHGRLLRVRREGDVDVAESLDPDGSIHELWRGP